MRGLQVCGREQARVGDGVIAQWGTHAPSRLSSDRGSMSTATVPSA
jgi:hypothetical protein